MRVGITGARGLLGWHTSALFSTRKEIELRRADRDTFTSKDKLENFVRGCDVIVHFAGMNRGEDREIFETNIRLTTELLAACEATGTTPHLFFSSSVHIYRETLYGASKRACTEALFEWSRKRGTKFTNLILPHIFGELGKPFYNSAVSTFCHQLARNEEPQIHVDSEMNLLHAGRVAKKLLEMLDSGASGEVMMEGTPMMVSALLARLKLVSKEYHANIFPSTADPLDLELFNTYRSYLYPNGFPISLTLREDNRGALFEAIKTKGMGQAFLSTTKPGITRGNHFHLQKIERFCVLAGQARIRLRKLFSDEVYEYDVCGKTPQYIDIPTLHAHNISCTGDEELITLFWGGDIFDPKSPDTYPENV